MGSGFRVDLLKSLGNLDCASVNLFFAVGTFIFVALAWITVLWLFR